MINSTKRGRDHGRRRTPWPSRRAIRTWSEPGRDGCRRYINKVDFPTAVLPPTPQTASIPIYVDGWTSSGPANTELRSRPWIWRSQQLARQADLGASSSKADCPEATAAQDCRRWAWCAPPLLPQWAAVRLAALVAVQGPPPLRRGVRNRYLRILRDAENARGANDAATGFTAAGDGCLGMRPAVLGACVLGRSHRPAAGRRGGLRASRQSVGHRDEICHG